MPINKEHRELMKSEDADLNNLGKGQWGGACKAAAFLEHFIEKGTKWVHLDIAGPALKGSATAPDVAHGNGFGSHLMLHWIMNN